MTYLEVSSLSFVLFNLKAKWTVSRRKGPFPSWGS
jgi:hypothetical protein